MVQGLMSMLKGSTLVYFLITVVLLAVVTAVTSLVGITNQVFYSALLALGCAVYIVLCLATPSKDDQ